MHRVHCGTVKKEMQCIFGSFSWEQFWKSSSEHRQNRIVDSKFKHFNLIEKNTLLSHIERSEDEEDEEEEQERYDEKTFENEDRILFPTISMRYFLLISTKNQNILHWCIWISALHSTDSILSHCIVC